MGVYVCVRVERERGGTLLTHILGYLALEGVLRGLVACPLLLDLRPEEGIILVTLGDFVYKVPLLVR